MIPQNVKVSRRKLYDLVWSRPIQAIAKELGYSDKGLAKICDRLNVPRPPQGYWNKIQAGHKPEVIPLPEEEGNREVILSDKKKEEAKEIEPQIIIEVPDRLTNPHPLIVEAKRYFALPGKERTWALQQKIINLKVSSAAMPRALRVMDSLIKELEKRGAPVSVKEGKTFAKVGAEEVKFYIEEKNRLEIIEDAERKKKESYYYSERRFHPTGRLSLVIDEYCDHVRRLFQDGRKQTVEKAAGEFIAGLFEMAKAKKARTEYWEAERKKSEAWAKRREIEESRVKLLKGEIERMESISRIQAYLLALEEGKARPVGEGEIWASWVKEHLERIEKGGLGDRYLLQRAELGADKE